MNKFTFFKALFSPFKPFKLKWYCGSVAIGTPYFFPRKWVKATPKLATRSAFRKIDDIKKWNELNKNNCEPRIIPTFEEAYADSIKCKFPVPKKIGFDFVGLGWKTKWDSYRFEWSPLWSFVFFKWQIAVVFVAPEQSHYWESWLYYENDTDNTKTKAERIAQCRKEAPQKWTTHVSGKEPETIDYYDLILKDKYK